MHRNVAVCAALLAGALGSGCTVTIYQPLTSLQRPVVVDPRLKNFEGLRLLVRCFPSDDIDASSSGLLCRHLGTLFRNQGADVQTEVPRSKEALGLGGDSQKPPDLILEISGRVLRLDSSTALAILSGLTFTIIPTVNELSFAQDVSIRDANGFLLSSETFQERFLEYFGIGVWGVNKVLDWAVRSKEDALTGDVPNKEFSHALYSHLSQLVFNARVRSDVLKGFEPTPMEGQP